MAALIDVSDSALIEAGGPPPEASSRRRRPTTARMRPRQRTRLASEGRAVIEGVVAMVVENLSRRVSIVSREDGRKARQHRSPRAK